MIYVLNIPIIKSVDLFDDIFLVRKESFLPLIIIAPKQKLEEVYHFDFIFNENVS